MENLNLHKWRVPFQFFETKGIGQSNDSAYPCAYHLALQDAGICTCNIMTYSSIIPKNAELVTQPAYEWFYDDDNFGAVCESIMAVQNGTRSQIVSAGLMYNWLYKDNGDKVGGIVVERHGNFSKDATEERLYQSIYELKNKSFSHLNWNENEFRKLINSFEVDDQYGTALAAICFINYK